MKFKTERITGILILLLVINGTTITQDKTTFTAREPALITSAGQSADVLMIKILSEKAGISYLFDKTATVEKLDSVESLIIVSGGSSKGLGAASIDKDQELARAEKLIEGAKSKKLPVIVVHVGGKSRRGDLSDYFNKPMAEVADHLIVVKEGDHDSFFSDIAKSNKIMIELPEKINDIQGILGTLYGKE
jgi:hypothetical protein